MAQLTVNVVQIESVVDHPNADRLFFGIITDDAIVEPTELY